MKCCKDECYGTKTEILAVKTQGETGSARELGINPRNDVPFSALAKRFSQGAMLFYHNTKHALGGNLGFPLLSTVPGPEQNTAPGHPCSVLLIFILKTNFIIRHFEFTFTEHFNKMILTVLFLSEKIIDM